MLVGCTYAINRDRTSNIYLLKGLGEAIFILLIYYRFKGLKYSNYERMEYEAFINPLNHPPLYALAH